MVAYLDLIILENVCMNYLILYTTGKILMRKVKKTRMLIASLLGSVFVFSLYVNIPTYLINISKIAMAFALIKVAFNSNKMKMIMKEFIVFMLVTFAYAGSALAFVHMVKPKVIYIVNGVIIGGEYIFELVLVSGIVSLALIVSCTKMMKLKKKYIKGDTICKVIVFKEDKHVSIRALLDTGNLLTDPISKSPVIVSQLEKIEPIIPSESLVEIMYMMGGDVHRKQNAHDANIKVIPYKSVGNSNGIMVAYKVDCVKVEYQDEVYEIKNAVIGFCKDTLSKNNKYSALIGLKMLEEGKVEHEPNTDTKKSSEYSVC